MAGPAGFSFVHIFHLCFEFAGFKREDFGVAVSAFVHAEMDVVTEVGLSRFCLEEYVARFVAFMALVALTGYGKCIFAIMAGTAGSAFLHAFHGRFERTGFVREGLGVAVRAFEHAVMDLMAEKCICYTFQFERYFTRLHPLVTAAAVAGNGKRHLAVMTGSAGFPFFHLRHSDIAVLAGDDLAVMTAAA